MAHIITTARMFTAPPFYTYNAYALKIGDFVFVGGPGEAFTEIGLRVYAASPFSRMMVCCLVNASCGYVPSGDAYGMGGYEDSTSSFGKGADDAYVEAMVAALKKIEEA